MAKSVRALLDTVVQALPEVGNLGLLFFLLFFIFAALGVELFGRVGECLSAGRVSCLPQILVASYFFLCGLLYFSRTFHAYWHFIFFKLFSAAGWTIHIKLVKMLSVCVLVLTRVAQVWQAVANYCLSGKIFKWNALEPSILYEYNWNRHRMGYEALLAWKCLFTPTFFGGRFLTGKIGQIGLIFGVWSGFIRGLCSQDYKSLCAT